MKKIFVLSFYFILGFVVLANAQTGGGEKMTGGQSAAPDGMVYIAGGTFLMGSPVTETGRRRDETAHPVTVSSFYISPFEVTQREYQALTGTNPSSWKGGSHPVEHVSWFDAVRFCNAKSKQEGLANAYEIKGENVTWNQNANGYRLPTEAEWEYACRAGSGTPFNTGENITASQANFRDNDFHSSNEAGEIRTLPVGSFAPNAWGLYDMHGNVWEWCWDWYGAYSGDARINPLGASSGTARVDRGGAWIEVGPHNLRSACRDKHRPADKGRRLGFRLARSR
ncbi:MAG: formylglycine-generating enzyme family protein [Fusobacteriaceae bacterium]|nr:formylglycine-generating enzyme family protein [Fusobacteriaceae bacterium]